MTTNIILECRQSDTNSVSANGIYESYLANDIIINEGDVIQLKSAFVDTKKEDNINIENDLTLTIKYGVYFTDWIEDTINKIEYFNASGQDIFLVTPELYRYGSVYNGKRYIPYYNAKSTGVEFQDINSVSYNALGIVFGEGSPDMPVVYQYIDALSNQVMTVRRTIPESPAGTTYIDQLGFVVKAGSFQIISPSFRDMEIQYFWKYISQNVTPVPISGLYSPYIFTKNISLPAGSYSPNNLSLLISKLMSDNNIDNTSQTISNNSFVKYRSAFDAGSPHPNGATGVIPPEGVFYFSDDMSTRFRFGSNAPYGTHPFDNYLFGSTQTALEFDPDSNTFNWAYLHSPLYDMASGENISVRTANIGLIDTTNNSISNNYLKTTDNGGIFFTELSAVTTNNIQPFDFWAGLLGFNLSKICVSPRPPLVTSGTNKLYDLTGRFYSYVLTPGVNITSGYSGVDASIIKSANASPKNNWYTLSNIEIPKDNSKIFYTQNESFFSNISTTTPLIADTPYTELIDTFSHFIIDADLNFIGDYVGLNKYNNIQGTVSKYYQVANYVIGDSDGAIQYQHRGLPILLKSIRVKILRSDKTPDPNLGKDNTILFQLIKSNEITKSK